MAKSNKTFLWIGLLGIGGIAAYEWWKGQQAAEVTTDGSTVPNTTNAVPSGGQPGASISTGGTPAGIDPTVYATVQEWGMADGRAPVLVMLAANIPSEYNGMYDIITNAWDKGIPASAAQTTFWNNLRGKYDPGDATW